MNHTVFGQVELFDVDIDWKKYLSEESSYVIYTPAGYFYFFYRICHSVGDCKNDNFFIDSSQIYLLI